MASNSSSPRKGTIRGGSSYPFPRATVCWLSDKKRTEPRDAWICISTSVRWVFVEPDDPIQLLDFSSFRGHFSLSLERLKESAVWEDVEKAVEPFDDQLGPGFVVNGKLSGRNVSLMKSRCVQLVVISDTVDERNALMDAVRIRMSPWQLLHKRMKEILLDTKLSGKALKALFVCAEKSNGTVKDHDHEEPSTFVETLEERASVAEGLDLLCGFVETVATVVKKSVPVAKDVAEEVADFAKCVTVVSSALQVVVICATLAEMGTEMKRGTIEWPRIRNRVGNLRGAIVKCMVPMLHPDGDVDELLVKNVFKVQQELVDVLEDVEKEMMRDSGTIQSMKRFLKANKLRRIEGDVERLEGCVLEAIQSSSIAQNSKALEDIWRVVKELKQNALSSPADTFKPYFDSPYLPSNLVFDFESCDEDGSYFTPEAILLNSVFQLREKGSSQGASALGTHGMGGVGKTTALKKICGVESIRSLFADGVCFMQFGQDATIQKVSEEMCCCVRNFGGLNAAKEMKSAPNLGDVVNRAAEWLKDRRVLLVCDDLWASEDNELGYVHELKKMLRFAPHSTLLISTRDRAIAQAVASLPVSFEALEPHGSKAKEILGTAAFGREWEQVTCDWEAESEYKQILGVCAGLPLALGIAGRGVKIDFEDSEDPPFAVQNYWKGLQEGGLDHLQGMNAEYHADGLKYVVQASLKLCEVWGRAGERDFDMRRLFRSLCVLEKQQSIPESTLKLLWGLGNRQVSEIVRKFVNLNIAKREIQNRSASNNRQFCLHLHDLILELCQEMAVEEQEQWHMNLVNAYRLTLEGGKVTETGVTAWWKVEDDGYVSENLSRHLVASGSCIELEALLNDVRWTLRRYEMGGWAALDMDFRRLLGVQTDLEENRVYKLHTLLKRCWYHLSSERSLFAFNIFGHLSERERRGKNYLQYLRSVTEYFPSPWLYPMKKCVGPEDSREQSQWNIGARISDLAVAWSSNRVVIASDSGIHVWSLTRQEELFKIAEVARCVAISEDGKLIASGHRDGTVRRWNGVTGDAVGEPTSGHTKAVWSIAMRGNLIVSGSSDKSLYRWNASTGAASGGTLQGHEGSVLSIAISADGKLIVSGSTDKTIRRWDAVSGEAIGFPMRGHSDRVRSLAISSDNKLILSGSDDRTIRRWEASTGEAISESLCGHNSEIGCLSISENGKCFVSSSYDGCVRLWDTSSEEAIGQLWLGHEHAVIGVAISIDGKLLLSGSLDGSIRQWDVSAAGNVLDQDQLSSMAEEKLFSGGKSVRNLVVSVTGKIAVSLSGANNVQRWDVLTGEAIGRPILDTSCWVDGLAISRDGTLIVTGGSSSFVERWDGSTGAAIGEPLFGHVGCIYATAISDDGKLIVTSSADGTVRRWDAQTGEPIGEPMEGSGWRIDNVAISSDGNVIISSSSGIIQRWCARSGEEIGDGIEVGGIVDNLVISNDGKIITCGSSRGGDYAQQWETMTGEPVGERMKWSEGKHVLAEMERARLCGDRGSDSVARKDTLPIETKCRADHPDENKIILGLQNGSVVICERR